MTLLHRQLPLLGGKSPGGAASRGLHPPGCLPNACPRRLPALHPSPGVTFLEASTRLPPAETQPVATSSPAASLRAVEDPTLT